MFEWMMWLEDSSLGHAVRDSSVWTYSIVNLVHVLGLATLFGSVLVLDLRFLGVWRSVPLAAISRPTVPLATVGFAVAVTSGVCLAAANATEYYGNPFLYVKFPASALGVVNVAALRFLPAWKARATRELSHRERLQLAIAGGISLLSWLTAIAAGRMIAYW
jgi:hypothetical protein